MKRYLNFPLPLTVLLLFSVIIASCTGPAVTRSADPAAPQHAVQPDDFRVVGYYSLNAAMSADVEAVPFDQLTHVNLWFLNPDSTGNYTRDLTPLKPFVEEAQRNNVQVLLSIGGGGSYPHYGHLLRDENRPRLIGNLVSEVLEYNLDGVDVDLEGSAIDENYEDFVVGLARSLREHDRLVTAAIAVYYRDQLTDRALAQYDFVNIMVYDRTGPWRPDRPGHHSTYDDAVEDLDYFGIERNIPREKMVLGVPFYGYAFSSEPDSPVRSMNFNEIAEVSPGTQWLDELELPGGYTLYYNGIPTIMRKTVLAKQKASGIMIWQLLGDAPEEKSLLRTINNVAYSY